MPKISFIVPVYNTEKYLPACLNSILNQTEKSMEVICINDGSKDNSAQILKHYEALSKGKLKTINLEENQGLSYARNIGLDYAQGEYIMFIDSDDITALNMGEHFIKVAKDYNVPIVIGKAKTIPETSYLETQTLIANSSLNLNRIEFIEEKGANIFKQNIAVWSKAYHHDLLEKEHFKNGSIYEDAGYTYRILLKAKEAVGINDFYYGYRRNSTGITSKSKTISPNIIDILDVCIDGKKYAQTYQLSEIEMNFFDDILKRELLKKVSWIKEWNIEKREQRYLIERLLSIFNYYFPNVTELETEKGKKDTRHVLRKLEDYEYASLKTEKEAIDVKKRTLRKIRSLQNIYYS